MKTRSRASQPGERAALLAARIARHWARRRPRRGLLALLGPGLITGASDDDPSGIATYSQAGAQFGYSMVWVMLFTWPLMAAIQEISARIGRVTGHGIAGNIRRHYPPWLLRGIVVLLLAANIINGRASHCSPVSPLRWWSTYRGRGSPTTSSCPPSAGTRTTLS